MDQTLDSINKLSLAFRFLNSSAQIKLLDSMQTPPVPSLITTSNSLLSQKLSNGTPFHQLSSSNMPPLCPKLPSGSRSSHEIVTIADSPVTKNPPPLLPALSIGLTGVQSFCSLSLLLALTHKNLVELPVMIQRFVLLLSQKTEIQVNQTIIYWA